MTQLRTVGNPSTKARIYVTPGQVGGNPVTQAPPSLVSQLFLCTFLVATARQDMADNGQVATMNRPIVNVRKKPLAWAVKRQIVEFATSHPEVTQGVIASKFGCNRSTVCKILKKRDKYEAMGEISIQKNRIGEIDERTYEWIRSMKHSDVSITGTIIKATASQIAERMGLEHFQPSNEWLRNLCRRYGIPLTVNNNNSLSQMNHNNNNNNSLSTPNNNLIGLTKHHEKFQNDRHSESYDESHTPEDEIDEYDEDGELEDEDDSMMIADDNFADHCLTDDANDVITMVNNNNHYDKMADRPVDHEEAMAAFETIRCYFEQESFLGEDLEVLFELEQLCAAKKKS